MAYPCRIWLKEECDGCGCCEGDRPMGLFGQRPMRISDDEGNPFDIDYDDER